MPEMADMPYNLEADVQGESMFFWNEGMHEQRLLIESNPFLICENLPANHHMTQSEGTEKEKEHAT